jgi:putative DNA primase/helicase
MSFNILDHLDKLEVIKETNTEYHCQCPNCRDGGFKVNKHSGKYFAHKCGCMDTAEGKKAVISALAPIPPSPPFERGVGGMNEKSIRPKQIRYWTYYSRSGEPLVRVCRSDFGDERKPWRWQESWDGQKWVKGLKGVKREDIPIYKYKEIKEAIARGETIFIVEGEPAADALWKLELPATTNIGGSGKWKPSDTQDLEGASVILCPDRDKPGLEHIDVINKDFPDAQWLYAFPSSPFWNNLPKSGGLDVADWIKDFDLTAEDIFQAIEPRRDSIQLESKLELESKSTSELEPKNIQLQYTQQCIEALYSEKPWRAIEGKLYQWTGKYYQKASNGRERKRISDWCYSTPVQVGQGWKYAYATASHVDNIWRWLLGYFSFPSEEVNPPGFNCLNGVVKIKWSGKKVTWELVPHDPKVVYTYISEVNFDPKADPTDCGRMLSCLEPDQQKLFLQAIAASLDLATIRSYQGREASRALLCKGHGSNGKDTLREAVRMLFGQSMSNATVSDFAAYDQGRKFCLSKLEGSLINWSSENSSFNNLDRLESLKAAITGDPLDMERKGVDERPMMLNAIFLFNVNEVPNLQAGMEAIQSRWAVLSFNKTYKKNADPAKGEIEADSRFRYDPNFLKEKVCPALLNKILEAIATLATDGIDYSCTTGALQDIQEETNHLWAFARDVGLDYQTKGRVYVNDLWELLFRWYIDNGTLEIISENGKEKKIWHDQPRRGDKNIKAPNQIYQRFSELFPKIKKKRDTDQRKGQFYLAGIAIGEAVVKQSEAIGEAVNLTQSGSEAGEAISYTWAEILNQTKKLSSEQKKQLASILLSDKGLASFISQKLSTENSLINNFTSKNPSKVEQTASLASPSHPERVTASPIASPTASPASPPQFKIDARVTTSDDKGTGKIIAIRGNQINVVWDETGYIQSHNSNQLRLLAN